MQIIPKILSRPNTGRAESALHPSPALHSEEADQEAELVRQAVRDPQAFASLYQRYFDRVYRYLFSRVGCQADAEDVAAQVFLDVWQNLPRYRPSAPFAAWLFTIARRRCADFYRKRKVDVPIDKMNEAAFPAPDLLLRVMDYEQSLRLARLIGALREDDRELILLRFSAGLQFTEIARLLGKKESAVKMALYRLVDQLKQGMEDRDG